jgi:putative membrane protein
VNSKNPNDSGESTRMNYLLLVLKGIAMGAANVIPGVSGGTIALITGIFERLIHAIKSFNLKAIRLLFSLKFKEFAIQTDLLFLIAVFGGILIAIVTLARLLGFLFIHYPVYIWSFFFGLVLASVFFVGKNVSRWSAGVVVTFALGAGVAFIITFLNPATENRSLFYLVLSGVVAMCSMILPGLSGSFVLILMGNYQLVMINAVNNLDLTILVPTGIGMIVGLLAFSHLLSWVFNRFRDQTIALLTGFILGSLGILWPWQRIVYLLDEMGSHVLHKGEPVIFRYVRYLPETMNREVIFALLFALTGIMVIWAIEKTAGKKTRKPTSTK